MTEREFAFRTIEDNGLHVSYWDTWDRWRVSGWDKKVESNELLDAVARWCEAAGVAWPVTVADVVETK